MCTLTFYPAQDGFIVTSNRDEAPSRKTLFPDSYIENYTKLYYPKDVLAGGTWLGVSEKKRLVCLLNGGFTTHIRKETYRMSRGLVVKDLLLATNSVDFIKNYNFKEIEPFTIVIIDWQHTLTLYQLVWDGDQKHLQELDIAPKIWSSSLLYSEAMKQKRNDWFASFLNETENMTSKKILDFHLTAGEGNKAIALVMDRGLVKTKSVTQVIVSEKKNTLAYLDIASNQKTTLNF